MAMSIKELFWKFSYIYVLMLIAFAGVFILAEEFFSIKAPKSLGTIIVCASIAWVSWSFGKKNGRYFSKSEKRMVVFGCLGISLLVQALIAAIVIPIFVPDFISRFAGVTKFMKDMYHIVIPIIAMIIVAYVAGAYLAIFLTKKQLIRDKIIQPE